MSDPSLPTPYAEQVLDVVGQLPPASAVSYGDVARLVGRGGPRQVGQALARFGDGVPWWRVVRADGSVAPGLRGEALPRLAAEGVPLLPGGERVDLVRARPPLARLRRTPQRRTAGGLSDPPGGMRS